MGISLLSLWLTLLWYPWPCSLKTKMFKSKSNLKHFINLLHFFQKNYFFCRKSISPSADGPWLKSIFFYSNGFLFWLRKKIMEHLSVLADIYSIYILKFKKTKSLISSQWVVFMCILRQRKKEIKILIINL